MRSRRLPFIVFFFFVFSCQLTVFSVMSLTGDSELDFKDARHLERQLEHKVKKGFLEAKEETRKQLGELKTLHLDKAKEKFMNWAHPSPPFMYEGPNQSYTQGSTWGGHIPEKINNFTIVIAAHGEQAYIERTLQSIMDHTDLTLLKEVIVIDDVSDPPLQPLCEKVKGWGSTIHVNRNPKRLGLVQSKIRGGNLATTDAIVFLDAHVSPASGWERPLIRHMETNYKRIVVPVIPIIDEVTWAQKIGAGIGYKMMFDWSLQFNWFDDGNDEVPVLSGGLFAVTKHWWHEGGEYDHGMGMWGGENIEQSIRTWRCGGEIYLARDSKVSHLFRPKFPYRINNTEVHINKIRTIQVWFDEPYRSQVLRNIGVSQSLIKSSSVNLGEREALKEKLQCKDFNWYVQRFYHVFQDRALIGPSQLLEMVPPLDDHGPNAHVCLGQLDASSPVGEPAMLVPCSSSGARRLVLDDHGKQRYMFRNRLHNAVVGCLDANGRFGWTQRLDAFPIYFSCSASNAASPNHMQTWKWDDDGLITMLDPHVLGAETGWCLKRPADQFGLKRPLQFAKCGPGIREQETGPWLRVKKYALLDI
jgi:glycosyltransferase involved in cell wall biosynthesis